MLMDLKKPSVVISTDSPSYRRSGKRCLRHPEKVSFNSLIDALDELQRRLAEPRHHVKRPYKCPVCLCWHFTSRDSDRDITPSFAKPHGYRDRHYFQVADSAGYVYYQAESEQEAFDKARERRGSYYYPITTYRRPHSRYRQVKFLR